MRCELLLALKAGLQKLRRREIKIVRMRFLEEKDSVQIAKRIHLSKQRVHQIEKLVLAKLRFALMGMECARA